MRKEEILLNKLAQDQIPLQEGIKWYDALPENEQKEVLNLVAFYVSQAFTSAESIQKGIELSCIEPTMTPVGIFQNNNLGTALNKISQLPMAEWRKAFMVLLAIFKVADTKRRGTWCKDGCRHEWHHLQQ